MVTNLLLADDLALTDRWHVNDHINVQTMLNKLIIYAAR